VLDSYVSAETVRLIKQGYDIDHEIDRNLLMEITAYVGEVICKHKSGYWQIHLIENSAGPIIRFIISPADEEKEAKYKAIDLYEDILHVVIEGRSLIEWYSLELE